MPQEQAALVAARHHELALLARESHVGIARIWAFSTKITIVIL
jgi:hypothetical protein